MEIRIIVRGALSGFVAGVLGFTFARIFAEPVINKAIAYESGRDSILATLNKAAGRPVAPDGRRSSPAPSSPPSASPPASSRSAPRWARLRLPGAARPVPVGPGTWPG